MSLSRIFELFPNDLAPKDFEGQRFEAEGPNRSSLEFEIAEIVLGEGEFKADVVNTGSGRKVTLPFPQHSRFEDADWSDTEFADRIELLEKKAEELTARLEEKVAKGVSAADAKEALQVLRRRIPSADPQDTRCFLWVPIIEAISRRSKELRFEKIGSQKFAWDMVDYAESRGIKAEFSSKQTEWLRDIAVRILKRADGAEHG